MQVTEATLASMKPDPQILDHRRTSADFAAARPCIALLPLGATEQHGAHLPCGTDTFQVSYLADEIARAYPEPVWRLPTIPITVSHMHRGSPGTVWLTNATLTALVKDMVLSLRHEGITRVVVLNGHGGNFVVRPIIQDLNRDYDDLRVILLEASTGERVFEEPPGSIHAGESETSRMLHVAPDLVRMDLAVDTDVPYTQSYLLYAPIARLEPSGVWGHATAATAEKGRRYHELYVPAAVASIQRTFAALDALPGGPTHGTAGPEPR
ncbi:MAG: Creatinine amidohydrolase [uncultured Chloroflexi bacterium]|uniref:Creatinine amidohydrolase n=1 Tax=uncultured Chloroflexota bacterium TaxID=166587 RepID=A0A6J4I5A8_9CHLR|nr:MAG: Creatinine amidohydrolase [uncultured Chloroflexota bacterium]